MDDLSHLDEPSLGDAAIREDADEAVERGSTSPAGRGTTSPNGSPQLSASKQVSVIRKRLVVRADNRLRRSGYWATPLVDIDLEWALNTIDRPLEYLTDFPTRCPNCERCNDEAHKALRELKESGARP